MTHTKKSFNTKCLTLDLNLAYKIWCYHILPGSCTLSVLVDPSKFDNILAKYLELTNPSHVCVRRNKSDLFFIIQRQKSLQFFPICVIYFPNSIIEFGKSTHPTTHLGFEFLLSQATSKSLWSNPYHMVREVNSS